MLHISSQIRIPWSELQFRFARSGGPGGQNVNKVNTKAILTWNFDQSKALNLELKDYMTPRLGRALNTRGEIVLQSDRFRSQERNREDVYDKLKKLLLKAASRPKKRKKTKISKTEKEKRLRAKKIQSEKKHLRKRLQY